MSIKLRMHDTFGLDAGLLLDVAIHTRPAELARRIVKVLVASQLGPARPPIRWASSGLGMYRGGQVSPAATV